ncbi:MAG TPA: Sir2 family NAD-dependent protein deacetylase [Armatimonadaceae bacterium]|nr:Sir2 family NAD-dependent protein deacetylase [Armatimonadaceae bacterium]
MKTITNVREVAPLHLDRCRRVVVLTGAGVSVASGLPTYRGPGGLWNDAEIARLVDARNLPESLPGLWNLYSGRRASIKDVGPNAAHRALAAAQTRLNTPEEPDRFLVVTQNIDGLHQRAGSDPVLELHGSGLRTRCSNPKCRLAPFADDTAYEGVPSCPKCGSALRPDVVLFGEYLDPRVMERAAQALYRCDLFLAVGTSGVVYPAASCAEIASQGGARTVAVNVEPMDPPNPAFPEEVIGRAEEVLPVLLGVSDQGSWARDGR